MIPSWILLIDPNTLIYDGGGKKEKVFCFCSFSPFPPISKKKEVMS